MATTYTGIPGNVTTYTTSPAAVFSTTGNNVSPIVITTTGAHNFQTGDRVQILGVTGNTNANSGINSPWSISVLTPTTFSLSSSVGNGAYVSGGLCFDLSLSPAFTLPSDGDVFSVAGVNVALQALGDRTQMLGKIVLSGAGYAGASAALIGQYVGGTNDDTWASWNSGNAANGSWQVSTTPDILFLSASNIRCNHGDYFAINMTLGEATAAATPLAVGLAMKFGCDTAGSATFKPIGGAARVAAGYDGFVSLTTTKTASSSGAAASVLTSLGGNLFKITGLAGVTSLAVGATITLWNANTPGNIGTFPITATFAPGDITACTIYNAAGFAGDANNNSIKWRVDNQPFDCQIWIYGIGGTTAYNFLGHRQIVVNHYRPTSQVLP